MDDRRRDGGTNSTLRTKEQGTHLTLNEHDDYDDEEDEINKIKRDSYKFWKLKLSINACLKKIRSVVQ